MGSIKEFNNKLKSLKNTQKITKTMKMVSASKLRKAQEAQVNAKLYAQNISGLTSRITASVKASSHPLLVPHQEVKNIHILVFTSDKGLCGAFNHNCHKHVDSWIAENKDKVSKIELSFCGKRGFMFFRKMENVREHYENITGKPNFEEATKIGNDLIKGYLSGEHDEVYLAYNQFFSPLSQKTVFEKVLPIDSETIIDESVKASEYIFEPEATRMLEFLIPHFLYFKVYFSLLENSAGEHGARMSAMDNASKNASDMIDKFTLLRNRARQAEITTELTEIVAGAEALK